MGKRHFDISAAELYGHDSLMSLDQGIGTATNDMRCVFIGPAGSANYFDQYLEHASDAARIENMSAAAITAGGSVTGILRINYDDTHPIDRVMAGIKAIREEFQMRGPRLCSTKDQFDLTVGAFLLAERCFAARGRYEGHVAANS